METEAATAAVTEVEIAAVTEVETAAVTEVETVAATVRESRCWCATSAADCGALFSREGET